MDNLIKTFSMAKSLNLYTFVVVSIFGKEELIINKPENTHNKLEYYKNAYTEMLKLKSNPDIKIVNFGCRKRNVLLMELKDYLL